MKKITTLVTILAIAGAAQVASALLAAQPAGCRPISVFVGVDVGDHRDGTDPGDPASGRQRWRRRGATRGRGDAEGAGGGARRAH